MKDSSTQPLAHIGVLCNSYLHPRKMRLRRAIWILQVHLEIGERLRPENRMAFYDVFITYINVIFYVYKKKSKSLDFNIYWNMHPTPKTCGYFDNWAFGLTQLPYLVQRQMWDGGMMAQTFSVFSGQTIKVPDLVLVIFQLFNSMLSELVWRQNSPVAFGMDAFYRLWIWTLPSLLKEYA